MHVDNTMVSSRATPSAEEQAQGFGNRTTPARTPAACSKNKDSAYTPPAMWTTHPEPFGQTRRTSTVLGSTTASATVPAPCRLPRPILAVKTKAIITQDHSEQCCPCTDPQFNGNCNLQGQVESVHRADLPSNLRSCVVAHYTQLFFQLR